jgi:hypothetical protein
MAVENAAIDKTNRGHDQRKFPPDRPRRIVGIILLRENQLQRRMNENKQAKFFGFRPKRFEFRGIKE